MATEDKTVSSASSRPTEIVQPPAFGCRNYVFALLFGMIGGVIGAGIIGQVWKQNPVSQNTTNQTVQVDESSAIVNAVKKASPPVVSILTTQQNQTFVGPIEQKGGGTGFILTNDGLIGTNKHVAQAGTQLTVLTNDGKTYPASVKAIDPAIDFALIKIEAKNLPVVDLGNSDNLQVGQEVIAIGNALGEFENTVTTGVVSAKERSIEASTASGAEAEQLENLLQTDAAINPGNSGGPLVNLLGQVVGVNTAVAGEAQGIGFAIPINSVKQAIDSYQKSGKIIRPSLGVRYVTITKEVASINKLPVDKGAWLVPGRTPAVVPGSGADKAGLKPNDIIIAVNGVAIDDDHSLPSLIARYNPGDEVEITYMRDGQESKTKVKLDAR